MEKQKKKYKHLDQLKRDRIQSLLDNGHKQKDIAKVMGVDKSTISREIKRNRRKTRKKGGTVDGPYEATVADHKAYVRRLYAKYQGKKINENRQLKEYIIERLEKYWSPDEISGRMKFEKQPCYASKTAIYDWLYNSWYGYFLCPYLYSKRCKPRRNKKKTKRIIIPNRISIHLRPNEANNKTRYGHYEGDAIVSGKKHHSKKSLTVIYERKAKYVGIRKIDNLKPALNNQAIASIAKGLNTFKSLTLDNGIENIKHEQLKEQLDIDTYFCDPYSAWQKPGVENANKQIRRFIPKGSDINNYSEEYVASVADILNNKPRKSLGYKTPLEVMIENGLLKDNKKTSMDSLLKIDEINAIIPKKLFYSRVALEG